MGTPLDLESFGIAGNRNVAAVKKTESAMENFTNGSGNLGVRQDGNLVPMAKTAESDPGDPFVMSRIGRNFRSF